MAWGYPGVGTPCSCSDCPLSQPVLWHHQHTWGSWTCHGGICPSSAPESNGRNLGVLQPGVSWGLEYIWNCKQVLKRQKQLQGKRYLRVGHWREEEKKAGRRQRYRLREYIRKGPVDRNATWRRTYFEIQTDMSGEGRNLGKGYRQMSKTKKRKEKQRRTYMIEKTKKKCFFQGSANQNQQRQ